MSLRLVRRAINETLRSKLRGIKAKEIKDGVGLEKAKENIPPLRMWLWDRMKAIASKNVNYWE